MIAYMKSNDTNFTVMKANAIQYFPGNFNILVLCRALSYVDNLFSKLAARNPKLYMPYERPHSSDCAEQSEISCRQ